MAQCPIFALIPAQPVHVAEPVPDRRREGEISGSAQEDFPGGMAAYSLPGHYLFRNDRQPIDLEAILAHAGFD